MKKVLIFLLFLPLFSCSNTEERLKRCQQEYAYLSENLEKEAEKRLEQKHSNLIRYKEAYLKTSKAYNELYSAYKKLRERRIEESQKIAKIKYCDFWGPLAIFCDYPMGNTKEIKIIDSEASQDFSEAFLLHFYTVFLFGLLFGLPVALWATIKFHLETSKKKRELEAESHRLQKKAQELREKEKEAALERIAELAEEEQEIKIEILTHQNHLENLQEEIEELEKEIKRKRVAKSIAL